MRIEVTTGDITAEDVDAIVNAARNILKVLVAAGLAETQNACGAGVRPPAMAAVGDEAGTHPGAT